MASIYDVPANDLIEKTALELQKLPEIRPPEWAKFAKTGHFKQRPPEREDWWYVRSAAVLRSVARLGPMGVQKLRSKYGGAKDRGHAPEHTYKAGGNILRKILQQLEAAQLVKQASKGLHKGRILTPKGISLLGKAATEVRGPKVEKPKRVAKAKPEPKEQLDEPKME